MKLLRTLLVAAAAAVSVASHAQPLRIGVTPGALADSVNVAAKLAQAQGLEVKVVEFSDWTTPNTALDAGDLDLNYFQHQAFLDNAIKERGFKLTPVAYGVLTNVGLYSVKVKSFAELKEGARVGIASEPVNQGRGLLLLQKAGLIKLKDGVGWRGSVNDVVANPKKLKLVEVEGPQLVRAIDDLDLAQGYPAHFVNAGRAALASNALLYSGVDDLYFAIRFVARADRAADPRIARFVKVYQEAPEVKAALLKANNNDPKLFTIAWTAGNVATAK